MQARLNKPLMPGASLGVFGGGQLGRMFVNAARAMAYRTVVFDPDGDSPAGQIADEHIQAAYSDEAALNRFAGCCGAITTEFENVPVEAFEKIHRRLPTSPHPDSLRVAQDRIAEKRFLHDSGIKVVPYAVLPAGDDPGAALAKLKWPLIIKTARFGYDGKGQARVNNLRQAADALRAMAGGACVAEQVVDLEAELSVVVARSADGECTLYPVSENEHRNGILHMSTVPAPLSQSVCDRAAYFAIAVADALDYCGVLAVEFFLGASGELFVNEIAPRPHNSGHYTIDACAASQFEQQIRMMCGIPAAAARLLTPVVMVNLLGDLWRGGAPDWSILLSQPDVRLHLYGKREARKGRKMGHFCVIGDDVAALRKRAAQLHRRLSRGLP